MAYASPIQTSVNSGELSPRMVARVDFERYRNGCARARNLVLLPTGGFTKAPGSRFVNAIKDETKVGRLLPFKFSQDDAYVIEMGENAARFYRRQARISAPNIGASITNGTFASNITGWTDASASGASIAHSATGGGRMALTPAGNARAIARQQVSTTTTGVEHVLAFKIDGTLGASLLVYVGSSAGAVDLFPETRLGIGWHTVAFTPSASPFHIHFANDIDNPAEVVYLDDVSLLDNVPLELTHDYSESELQNISIRQTADVLYLFHPTVETRKFERRGDRTWSLVSVPWEDGPYREVNEGFDYLVRQLVTNPDFKDGIAPWADKGTGSDGQIEWDATQKIAVLTPANDANEHATLEQEVDTGISVSTEFLMHFRVIGTSRNGASDMVVQIGSTSGAADVVAATTYRQGWHSITFTTDEPTLFIRFRQTVNVDGNGVPGAVGGCFLYRSNAHLLELDGTEGNVACAATGHTPFKSTDIGRIIRLTWPGKEPAWGVITAFTSTSQVDVQLRRKAPYADVPTENWQLGKWSATTGYPATAAFFQSRIVSGNTEQNPNAVEFTQTGDLENMRPDTFDGSVSQTQDDDALSYQIAAEEVNDISWMTGRRKLIIGTGGGQFVAESQGAALKATDISITPHSDIPCKQVAPIAIEHAVIFIEASGRQLHDLGFQLDDDSFVAADLTILADHMLRSPAQEAALQRRPLQTVWVRREDGRLAVLAYNRKQDIVGWSHRILGGSFGSGSAVVESITTIPGVDDDNQVLPSGERDEVWMIVKRTINGSTRRYVEYFEGYYEGVLREDYSSESAWRSAVQSHMQDAFYVDCGGTYDGSPTATITGLDHLEGQTVAVLADGRVHSNEVVSGGQITLDFEASVVHVGLPYTWEFESLKLPFGTQAGSGVGKLKSIAHVGLCLLDSGPFTIGISTYDEEEGRVLWPTQTKDWLRDGQGFDEAVPLFTGETHIALEGATRRDVRVFMTGSDPLPFTCLSHSPQMNANEK